MRAVAWAIVIAAILGYDLGRIALNKPYQGTEIGFAVFLLLGAIAFLIYATTAKRQ